MKYKIIKIDSKHCKSLLAAPGVFSSLPKDPIILVDTPPPPKADGGTQDSDSGKWRLLSPFAAIQNIGVSRFATKPITFNLDFLRNQVFCSSGKEKIFEGPQCTNVHEDPDEIFDAARRQKTLVSMKSKTGPGSRSQRGVTGGEQPPAHQELNTPVAALTSPLHNLSLWPFKKNNRPLSRLCFLCLHQGENLQKATVYKSIHRGA